MKSIVVLLAAALCLSQPAAAIPDDKLLSADEARLQEVLTGWKAAYQSLRTYHATGARYNYDAVFEVETRGKFEHAFVESSVSIIRSDRFEIDPDDVSQWLGRSAKPYELRSELPEIWFDDGKTLSQVHVNQNIYARHEKVLPSECEDQDETTWPLSFIDVMASISRILTFYNQLFTPTQKFFDRHKFRLEPEQAGAIAVTATPLRQVDKNQYRSLHYLLDKQSYRIRALKIIDPSGNRETVYVLSDVKINEALDENSPVFEIPWDQLKQFGVQE